MKKQILTILMCMLVTLSMALVACGHRHTYSKKWSSDENYHWHAATCEHDGLIRGKAEHSFGEDGKCSICNRAKKDTHEHTYSEEWSKDATHHWHAATCEHADLVKDKAEHSFNDSGKCTECDYKKELSAMDKAAGIYYAWVFDGKDYVIDKEIYVRINSDGTGKIIGYYDNEDYEKAFSYALDGYKIVLTEADGDGIVEGCIKDGKMVWDGYSFGCFTIDDEYPFKKSDNVIYGLNLDGNYCAKRVTDKEIASVEIRSEIDGESVTAIADYAFADCGKIERVQLPDSITEIGIWAFGACGSLVSVTIGNGVTSIGAYAFNGCANLKSIVIPGSITSIGDSAFMACGSLEGAVILNGVTSIGDSAFRDCSSLASIIIANSVTSIGDYAFADCSSLASIIIPESLVRIGDYAFYRCGSLESIRIPNGVASIGDYAFYWCENLSSITIPDSVTSIGEYAFQLCGKLESIVIPKSVTSIGKGAFGGFWFLGGLKTVYYKGGAEEWQEINIGVDNGDLTSATRYYYSEEEPSADDNYNDFWHYVGGEPTVWSKE